MGALGESALAPSAIVPLRGSTATAVAWRSGGELHVTVIAKATFAFAPDAAMTRAAPQEILRADVPRGPGGDLAPYLRRADVLFTGRARASLRLALFAGQRCVLDSRPLAGDAGRGARGPGSPRHALHGPIAEIPEGFDWSCLQAAPPDQQIDALRGDEWILLEGLRPSLPRVRTCLPSVRGAARIHGLSASGVPEGERLDLVLDTLRIDGEELRCIVVCRRYLRVAGEAALAALRVVAGVEFAGAPAVWPDPRAAAGAGELAPERRGQAREVTTFALGPEEQLAAADGKALPFQVAAPPAPGIAVGPPREHAPVARASTGTLALPPEPPPEPPRQRSPEPLPAPPPEPSRQPPPELSLERHAVIAAEIAEARSPRAEVLRAHGLDERAWAAVDDRWTSAIREDAARGAGALRGEHDRAYVAAVERLRGSPITLDDYARLTQGASRGRAEEALDALRIQRPALMPVIRLWTRRVAADPKLAKDLVAVVAAAKAS